MPKYEDFAQRPGYYHTIPCYQRSVPPYYNIYDPTLQRSIAPLTDHGPDTRGNPPMMRNSNATVPYGTWSKCFDAAGTKIRRFYAKQTINGRVLNREELAYLSLKNKKTGLTRRVAIKLLMATGRGRYSGMVADDHIDVDH